MLNNNFLIKDITYFFEDHSFCLVLVEIFFS